MTTVRLVDAVDVNGARVPCRHCGEWLIASTDGDGQEMWECLECLRRVYPNVGGYATEGSSAGTWPIQPCADCGADVIECTSIRGLRMFVDAVSGAGIFSLHPVAGRCPQAQYDWGHRSRRLYSSHARTCTAKAVS
jgi:hypothetical protein